MPLHPFVRAVARTLQRRRLLGAGDRVLVALSGGPDSTALLAALAALSRAGSVGEVRALHVDHGLRAGSAADAGACRELCARLGVPLEVVRVRVAKGNVQARARQARYAALREASARLGARIATGHQRGDQAETVLLRLLRGAGARGLAAIPPRRGPVVRPLIDVSRADVLAYLRDERLPWLEDPTNATPRYRRNRVRAELLPALAALNPSIEASLARLADLAREDERALAALARAALPEQGAAAGVAALRRQPVAVRRRMVRELWRRASGRRAGLEAHHVGAVLELLAKRRPARIALPRGLEARVAYGELALAPAEAAAAALPAVELPGLGRHGDGAAVCEVGEAPTEGALAVPAALFPLTLRPRRAGDRFHPEGGRGGKKLGRWLMDKKVPRPGRDALLVLADRQGEVLFVPSLAARSARLAQKGKCFFIRLPPGPPCAAPIGLL